MIVLYIVIALAAAGLLAMLAGLVPQPLAAETNGQR